MTKVSGGHQATHGLSRMDFDALARGGGNHEAVLALRSAKRSKLLVTLLSLLESAPAEAGPLGSFGILFTPTAMVIAQTILQVGYRVGERVIRPARVAVVEPKPIDAPVTPESCGQAEDDEQ